MCVVMIKPCPLPHPHMLNIAHPVPWKPYAKFQTGMSFNLLLIAKQHPVGVATAKLHPMWLIVLIRVFGEHKSNFRLICPLIGFWYPNKLTVGVAMTKLHLLPNPHVVINAHPVTWRSHDKFRPFWSKGLAVMARHTNLLTNQNI